MRYNLPQKTLEYPQAPWYMGVITDEGDYGDWSGDLIGEIVRFLPQCRLPTQLFNPSRNLLLAATEPADKPSNLFLFSSEISSNSPGFAVAAVTILELVNKKPFLLKQLKITYKLRNSIQFNPIFTYFSSQKDRHTGKLEITERARIDFTSVDTHNPDPDAALIIDPKTASATGSFFSDTEERVDALYNTLNSPSQLAVWLKWNFTNHRILAAGGAFRNLNLATQIYSLSRKELLELDPLNGNGALSAHQGLAESLLASTINAFAP